MQQEDFDHALKVVVVGNGNVGKSSLIRKFCRNEYVPTYKKTIGVDYQERELVVKMSDKDDHDETEERKVRIMVWDCAGQEDFDQITRDYYTDADAVILAFSANDRGSFDMIKGWKSKLESVLSLSSLPAVLLQNKIDVPESEVQVQTKEAEQLARSLNLRLFRISVKDNDQSHIDEVFSYLAKSHFERLKLEQSQSDTKRAQSSNIEKLFTKEPTASVVSLKGASQEKDSGNDTVPTIRRTGGKKDKCIVQ